MQIFIVEDKDGATIALTYELYMQWLKRGGVEAIDEYYLFTLTDAENNNFDWDWMPTETDDD